MFRLIEFAKMAAPSYKNLPAMRTALEISMFFNIFKTATSAAGFNWNFVVMPKSLPNLFTQSIMYLFGETCKVLQQCQLIKSS